MSAQSFHDCFAQLRSLLQRERLNPSARAQLWATLTTSASDHPKQHEEVCLPYLADFPRHLEQPLTRCSSLDALEQAIRCCPVATFELAISELKPGELDEIMQHPALSRVQALELIRQELEDDELKTLARSPQLSSLRSLELSENLINDEGVLALARSPHLGELHHLGLSLNMIGVEGLDALKRSPQLRRLRRLAISSNVFGVSGVDTLLTWELPCLTHLDIGSNDLGDEGLRRLLEAPLLRQLQRLDLYSNELTHESAVALAEVTHLEAITRLDLFANKLGDQGLQALLQASTGWLERLHLLDVGDNRITDEGALQLAKCQQLGSLYELSLCYNKIGAPGAQALLDALPALRRLDLSGNPIDTASAMTLLSAAQSSALEHLKLGHAHFQREEEEWDTEVTLPHLRWG